MTRNGTNDRIGVDLETKLKIEWPKLHGYAYRLVAQGNIRPKPSKVLNCLTPTKKIRTKTRWLTNE
jgi:hypothetical protein